MDIQILNFQRTGALSVVQFKTSESNSLYYISSSYAIKNRLIEVKEISDQGSVNNLFVINHSDKFVFFMDGDILIGAKQNRVLNTSVLLLPNSKTTVPVSCVEAGRWRFTSSRFYNSEYTAPSVLRYSKASRVKKNLENSKRFSANQDEVWNRVSEYERMHKYKSKTSNISDIYENKKHDFNYFLKSFVFQKESNGIAIFIRSKLLNIDVFNRNDIYEEYFSKILRGTALEVYYLSDSNTHLNKIEAEYKTNEFFDKYDDIPFDTYEAVGIGQEKRFETSEVTGFELSYDRKMIHMTALNMNNKA